MNSYFAIGLMSGTSLDGVDIAYCQFTEDKDIWSFNILTAETIPYTVNWQRKLKEAQALSGRLLISLHNEYGRYLGALVNEFIRKNGITEPGIIASHGHTVYHMPDEGYTFQIGHGAAIAALTGIDVVSDFRSLDVQLGGTGAPLVPLGDQLLFPDYTYCLNLGGFANISFLANGKRIAFDTCPLNIVINRLVQEQHISVPGTNGETLAYDPDGEFARKGSLDADMLQRLNDLAYYSRTGAKSLGEEWVLKTIFPLFNEAKLSFTDTLRTFYEHAAEQIVRHLQTDTPSKALFTGGGCYNTFFMELVRKKAARHISIVVPGKEIIEFKEALIFALLGVRRLRGDTNCLSSVTGSTKNHSGGSIFSGRATS
jgi:anhydro-N-acetylmuramic acid kinase